MADLPRYRCHKVVQAAKIVSINATFRDRRVVRGAVTLKLDGDHKVDVMADWVLRHKPQVGGYYVDYADGYSSYSPAEAFESGYTRIEE